MLDTKYNHKLVEENKYSEWLKQDLFKSGNIEKTPFCVVIPPPNVTGKLHLGHAWDTTLQDIVIRYKRMDGFDALWVPGMDHAGIATQAKVDARLGKEGINPRSLNREDWLNHAHNWKNEYASVIRSQWGKLGLSLDYSKERFTLDEGLSKAVNNMFIDLYNKGLIYRGERIINWDPSAKTALSNEEVIYKETEGAFYNLKYKIEDSNEYLIVATTRPETIFGDTAVAVNKKDKRYMHLIGKSVIVPLVNRIIPIIEDDHADMSFGTGIVKITPAHDPNDFLVGERHNLEKIIIMNEDATMNDNAYKYAGLDRFDCRKKVIEDLKKENLLASVEKILHNVGYSERTNVMVEPFLSKQWFVKMEELSKKVLDVQKTTGKINFVPDRFEKILTHWMEIAHDWCISRQLWWGHRIPAYYKGKEVYVGFESPGEDWVQDEDVLDTWFSSALWPFSTLGFPDNTNDLKRYFPNNLLVTGYDIIFFWVCRMAFMSLEATGKMPFNDLLIHGLIRDKSGRKMSKSLGNGVDPMDVIEEFGADSLRFYLTTSSSPGADLKYDTEKVKSTWNFINKIWNASRFVLMNLDGFKEKDMSFDNLKIEDKWILDKLNKKIKIIRKHMEKYEFNVVGSELYNFIWNDFCDSYIELSKKEINSANTKTVLLYILENILKLLHPFMPYVTDEIYSKLPFRKENITLSTYPEVKKEFNFKNSLDKILEDITKIRNLKVENNITKTTKFNYIVNEEYKDYENVYIKSLKLDNNFYKNSNDDEKLINISYESLFIKINYCMESTNVDIESLEKDLDNLLNSVSRRKKLLSNSGYVSKAPENIRLMEEELLKKELEEIKILEEKIEKQKKL